MFKWLQRRQVIEVERMASSQEHVRFFHRHADGHEVWFDRFEDWQTYERGLEAEKVLEGPRLTGDTRSKGGRQHNSPSS